MSLLWFLLAGFCVFNALPHLVKGITGQTHMTPFKRVSSPVLNIVWGFVNLLFGLFIFSLVNGEMGLNWPWEVDWDLSSTVAFLVGGFAVSVMAAKLFEGPNARLPWHRD